MASGAEMLTDATIGHVLLNSPRGARFIGSQPPIRALQDRLPDNYTLIRPNVVDTFRCDGRVSVSWQCVSAPKFVTLLLLSAPSGSTEIN